ncbi:MAG: MFS transporter [Betaproteobacteria bacterium]|nr:MFS transporter [Betaproteobacteria bacterium]
MAALDTAIIGPAIPALRAAFGVDNREVGLVMVVFILFSLTSTALMANLSDRHGRRPVYLFSVGIFAAGSLLIALSPSFWLILVGRALQGIGGGGIVPSAAAVIGDVLPVEQQGKALGMLGAIYGMAFFLGPPLAAAVMIVSSWHWIFLLNLPIAAAILFLGLRVLPRHERRHELPALDLAGIVAVFGLLTLVVFGITRVVDTFTGIALWPYFLLAAAVAVILVIRIERRAAMPMIPLGLFRNRQLALTYTLATGGGFGMGSVVFLTSIATFAYGLTPQAAGFALLPLVVGSMIGSMAGGRMLNRLGSRTLLLVGFALMGLGYAGASVTQFGLPGFLVATVPAGIGLGVIVGGALRAIAMAEAPAQLRGTGQGLVNVFNGVGTLTSAATISAIADFRGGGAAGFSVAYLVVAGVLGVMFLIALALRAHRPRAAA